MRVGNKTLTAAEKYNYAYIFLRMWIVLGLVSSALFSALFYVWIFIFISGSSSKGDPYDEFIMKICAASNLSFFRTLLTWGYLKRSFKNCYRYHKLKWFPVPEAKLGSFCPDAKLVDLKGGYKSLLSDYASQYENIPLILNMGSYT